MRIRFGQAKDWAISTGGVAVIGLLLWFPGGIGHCFWSVHVTADRARCLENLRFLTRAELQYGEDNNGVFPDAHNWFSETCGYWEERDVSCPAVSHERAEVGYAMNTALSRKKPSTIQEPATAPLLFDSTLVGLNATSGLETLPKPGRHFGTNMIGYADGHAKPKNDPYPR